MKSNQKLHDIAAAIIIGIRDIIDNVKPEIVLVHGDTLTSTAAALSYFYSNIDIGHVEAGLRTNNILSPWPEEANRQLTSRIATLNFAPTKKNQFDLINENIDYYEQNMITLYSRKKSRNVVIKSLIQFKSG